MQTTPTRFSNPHTLANRCARLAWTVVHAALVRPTPWFMGGWRSLVCRAFGARLGRVRMHGTVRIWAPWRLKAGRDVFIDRSVYLYNAYGIELGDRVIISFGTVLCTPTHDHSKPDYPLTGRAIIIEDDVWIAAEAFIGPGVRVGRGAVVGARAVVHKDVPAWTIVAGNPARVIRARTLEPA